MRPSRPGAGAVLREWWVDARLGLLPPGDAAAVLGGSAVVVIAIAAFWAATGEVGAAVWVPVLVVVALLGVSVPICVRVAAGDVRLRRLLLLGLVLKLAFVAPRLYVTEGLYGGEADTGLYHDGGVAVVENVREHGEWTLEGATIEDYPDESRAIGFVAGAVYLVVGTTYVGGYLAFAWISWCGLVMAFRAFQVAYPGAPPHLAAALVFLLPSLLYWPATIGKDAVMVLCLGAATLAMARLLTPARPLRGLVLLVPAAALVLQVRPHLVMILLVGAAASLLARSASRRRAGVVLATRIALLVALAPLLLVGLARMDAVFGDSDGGLDVGGTLERTGAQTAVGGSALATRPVGAPQDLPIAIVSVLYRPFPFEVSSPAVLVSSLEGVLLLVGTLLAGRWLWRIGPAAVAHPFAAFCAAYVLAFVFAFSNIANAGILARQRVQMFPILILLVAAAAEHRRVADLAVPGTQDDGGAVPPTRPHGLLVTP